MFDIDGMLRKQLRDSLDARQTLIFPEGDDPRIVTAASRLLKLAQVVLAEIAVGACRTMRDLIPLDVLPEIHGAVLSYSTRGSAVGPSVERIRAAEPLIRARLDDLQQQDDRYRTIHIVSEMQISAVVEGVFDQLPMRRGAVQGFLRAHAVAPPTLDAVVGRGGLLRPIEGGTYLICDAMLADLQAGVAGEHPSNLGAALAHELADAAGVPAFTVDPPVVDELDSSFRITGLSGVERRAAWHALSQRAAAKAFAESRNQEYQELNLIVAHLGGGISVGAHRHGRCVRVRDALFDGPMTPTRAGTLPTEALIDLCYSGISRGDLTRLLLTGGGLTSHLGTHDLREVERRVADGDPDARRFFVSMCTEIAAEIASHVPGFGGERVDRLILTGGMCRSRLLCQHLKRLLRPLGIKITILPGDREQEALRDGALRGLRGLEAAADYTRPNNRSEQSA